MNIINNPFYVKLKQCHVYNIVHFMMIMHTLLLSQVTCTVERVEDCNTQNMPPALSAVDIAQTREGIYFQSLYL